MLIRCCLEIISELEKEDTQQVLHGSRTWQMEVPADMTQMMTSIKTIDNTIDVKLQESMDIDLNFATRSVSVFMTLYMTPPFWLLLFQCAKNKLFTSGFKYFISCLLPISFLIQPWDMIFPHWSGHYTFKPTHLQFSHLAFTHAGS